MSTYRAWQLSLGAFLLVAGPLQAQAPTEQPLKMIFATWKDSASAANTMKHMSKASKDAVDAYAVLIKDKAGKVEVKQRHNQAGGSVTALQASQIVDSAIARLSAPVPSAADSTSAYAPTGRPSRLSEEDFKKISGMFGPGQSALLLVSPTPSVAEIKRSLGVGGHGAPQVVELEVKK